MVRDYNHLVLRDKIRSHEQVLSILSTKIMAAIFDCNGSRRLGKERNLLRGWLTVKNREGGAPFPRPRPPPSTLTPNQTWPLDLITLARFNKTPALQAKLLL